MRGRSLAALALALLPLPALAGAEGSWPPESRGAGQPRPGWVLVVPVSRDRSGALRAWDRSDPWMRRWVVPKPAAGDLRTVAVTGDAEDARLIDGSQLDEMDSEALHRLAGKYGASAVALAVAGADGDAAVAAWSAGNDPSWDVTMPGEDPKEGALRIIGDIFSGAAPSRSEFRIAAVRTIDGVDQYRIEANDPATLDALRTRPGVTLIELHVDGPQSWAIVSVPYASDVEDVLASRVDR